VWVNIDTKYRSKTLAIPGGHYWMVVGIMPLNRIWRSRRERELNAAVKQCLLAQGAKELTLRQARIAASASDA
jgi:hypothetical protein